MAETPTINWEGKSGTKYNYWIYPFETTFNDKKGANYVFAQETTTGSYKPIYIGQTGDLSERFDNHHKMPCIKRNNATHIHVHLTSSEQNRFAEETDLLQRWNTPCND